MPPTPYYRDEQITLYHGDCRDLTDWLTADTLVTDPPYGVQYATRTGETVTNDHDFAVADTVADLWGTRPMCVFANHQSLLDTLTAVHRHHHRVRVATWHKTNVNGSAPGNPWLADVEFVVCGLPTWPRLMRSGVLAVPRATGNPEWNTHPDAYLHPTQKPTPLMERVLLLLPTPGVVADPCAGSGSTLVAARNLGLHAIGVEIEEQHCETAARRLAQSVLPL